MAAIPTTPASPATVDPVKAFRDRMKQKGYITDNDDLMSTLYLGYEHLAGKEKGLWACVLDGPPGTGKTFAPECLRAVMEDDWKEAQMLRLQFTTGVGREMLMDDLHLSNIVTAQSTRKKLSPDDVWLDGILVQAIKSSQQQKTILLLDELDKAKPTVDSFLLEFLQMGGVALPLRSPVPLLANPANLLVFITKNNERQLSEPLMRRSRVERLGWPHWEIEWRMLVVMTRRWARQHHLTKYRDGAPEGMCKSFATYAERIRAFEKRLIKVPATPELFQGCCEMMLLPGDKRRRGHIAFRTLFKYEDDALTMRDAKDKNGKPAMVELHEKPGKPGWQNAHEQFTNAFAQFA